MKIVADKNIPLLTDLFGRHGQIKRIDGRSVSRSDLNHADVLLVRSVTRVGQDLLQGSSIQFVGSATIGIDHLDTHWLEKQGIKWAHAPGCNADSTAQYTLAMMWLACDRLKQDFRRQTVGIIGRGHVGRRLEHLLQVLDIPVVCCDPPLQAQGEAHLVSMDHACANSVISLHVPLTRTGSHPTVSLIDHQYFAKMPSGSLLVNTSRGGVIDCASMLAELNSGRLHMALDVWPDEPFIDPELLQMVSVATPHVAGYSIEGKQAGTAAIYQAFCREFSLPVPALSLPGKQPTPLSFPNPASEDLILKLAINISCPVARDDAALRQLPRLQKKSANNHHPNIQFDSLRSSYQERLEFKSHLIRNIAGINLDRLSRLGFPTD